MNKTASQVLTEKHNIDYAKLGYSKEEVERIMSHALSYTLSNIEKMSVEQKLFLRDLLDLEVDQIFAGGLA